MRLLVSTVMLALSVLSGCSDPPCTVEVEIRVDQQELLSASLEVRVTVSMGMRTEVREFPTEPLYTNGRATITLDIDVFEPGPVTVTAELIQLMDVTLARGQGSVEVYGNDDCNKLQVTMVRLEDADRDGIPDAEDGCPRDFDPSPTDSDGDGIGDECDNCKDVANPDQANFDGDPQGDACDRCPIGSFVDESICLASTSPGSEKLYFYRFAGTDPGEPTLLGPGWTTINGRPATQLNAGPSTMVLPIPDEFDPDGNKMIPSAVRVTVSGDPIRSLVPTEQRVAVVLDPTLDSAEGATGWRCELQIDEMGTGTEMLIDPGGTVRESVTPVSFSPYLKVDATFDRAPQSPAVASLISCADPISLDGVTIDDTFNTRSVAIVIQGLALEIDYVLIAAHYPE
jgi:hypothetical protein